MDSTLLPTATSVKSDVHAQQVNLLLFVKDISYIDPKLWNTYQDDPTPEFEDDTEIYNGTTVGNVTAPLAPLTTTIKPATTTTTTVVNQT